jgi:hypothetical protein
VHARHPGYRPVTKGGRTVSCGTGESEWRLKRSRHSDHVNAEVREAVVRDGYPLFPVVALARFRNHKTFLCAGSFLHRNRPRYRAFSPR